MHRGWLRSAATPRPGNPRWLDCATHGGIHYTEPDASPAPADTQPLSLTELDTFEMEDVEAQSIDWRWDGRLEYGKITLLDGDPGVGKSWCVAVIATAVTLRIMIGQRGGQYEPRDVLLLSAEDDPSNTIRPARSG